MINKNNRRLPCKLSITKTYKISPHNHDYYPTELNNSSAEDEGDQMIRNKSI